MYRIPACTESEVTTMLNKVAERCNLTLSKGTITMIVGTTGNDILAAMMMLSCESVVSCCSIDMSKLKLTTEATNMSKISLHTLMKRVFKTTIPVNLITPVRDTFFKCKTSGEGVSDICTSVLNIVLDMKKKTITDHQRYELIRLVATCDHACSLGTRDVYHFEQMIYSIYALFSTRFEIP